ncbi:hypothetical protein ACWDE9_36825 [Streptomyces olivaceoviridis]
MGESLAQLRGVCSLGKAEPVVRTDWGRVSLPDLAAKVLPEDAEGAGRMVVNA